MAEAVCSICGRKIKPVVKPSSAEPWIALCDECIEELFKYLRKIRKGKGED